MGWGGASSGDPGSPVFFLIHETLGDSIKALIALGSCVLRGLQSLNPDGHLAISDGRSHAHTPAATPLESRGFLLRHARLNSDDN